jgi:hypothetical protein
MFALFYRPNRICPFDLRCVYTTFTPAVIDISSEFRDNMCKKSSETLFLAHMMQNGRSEEQIGRAIQEALRGGLPTTEPLRTTASRRSGRISSMLEQAPSVRNS